MTADPTLNGTSLGPYRIVKRLGEGGMGRVYLAISPSGRAVAIKVLLAELMPEPGFRRRFRAEIDAARTVSGAFTAAVVDADPDGTPPWLATEFIPGPSLHTMVREVGPLAEADLVLLAAGVAEAVAAIHRAHIVHRDLTPMNVLLAGDGPRVIDFGISRIVDDRGLAPRSSRILGVPGYMAPERIQGQPCTPAGDVFSLGAVLAFAAQGHSPFGDGPDVLVQDRTLRAPPRLDGVPPRLRGAIAACLHKEPSRRPPSADLPGLFRGGPATTWAGPLARRVRQHERTPITNPPGGRLTRRRVLAGAATLVAAAAGGIVLARRGSGGQAPSPVVLAWTAGLERADLTLAASSDTTVICTDRTGAVAFDLAGGRHLWSDSVPLGASDNSDGTRVYSVRTDGRLSALDARTGKQLWVSGIADSPVFQLASPTTVVVLDGGRLRGIDVTDGTSRWTYQPATEFLAALGAVASGGFIANELSATPNAAATDFTYTMVDLHSGKARWQRNLIDLHAPATGSLCYGLDADMNLVALLASTGAQVWSKQTTLPSQVATSLTYQGSLHLMRGTLYCYPATEGDLGGTGVLAAFDPANGTTLWTVYPSSDAVSPATVTGGPLGGFAALGGVVCYVDTSMKALDTRTGKTLWSAGGDLGALRFAGTAGGLFLAAAMDGGSGQDGLYGWAAGTGEQVWRYPVTGGAGRWTFLQSPNGLLAARSGRLYAIRAR
jgi:outer membrane protein assembly factor BamB